MNKSKYMISSGFHSLPVWFGPNDLWCDGQSTELLLESVNQTSVQINLVLSICSVDLGITFNPSGDKQFQKQSLWA